MGLAFGHAGEFLQGAIGDGGALRRILISIPAPGLRSNAIFSAADHDEIAVTPKWKRKSLKAFHLAWLQFSSARPCGTLTIRSDIPVSRGMGSSTADCVAAIRAAASHWNCELPPDRIAMLAHQAECFSDATMYEDRLVVFQHCEGRIHENLRGDTPHLQLLIVEASNGSRKVDTDLLARPDYSPEEIRQFSQCLSRFGHATATNDIQQIAAIATISARINERYHPNHKLDELERIAAETGGLGVAVAHSGNIQILLYEPFSLGEPVLRKVSDSLEEIEMKCWGVLSTIREPETVETVSGA
jgi:uncharacterized protein involved in propanediol utilization